MKNRPNWTRDETILALDLYRRRSPPPGKSDAEVIELSRLLRSLWPSIAEADPEFRNPTGVYMKLMNLRAVDPDASGEGLSRASTTDHEVMEYFHAQPDRLVSAAARIKETIASNQADLETAEADDFEPGESEAVEGRLLTVIHRRRERDRKLIDRAKKAALKKSGSLACEGCGFDFAKVYGERGEGFIEAHHTVPLSEADAEGRKTRTADLALLCSNCHRMIHRCRPWLSMSELKALVRS
ncbi:conserved hypothetical protein [Oceanicaulis sp. 350]|nr:conserved hypothetical protein [Oceanicaulis sp. 350]